MIKETKKKTPRKKQHFTVYLLSFSYERLVLKAAGTLYNRSHVKNKIK